MRTNKLDVALRAATGAILLTALLAGCAKPAPVAETAPSIPDAPRTAFEIAAPTESSAVPESTATVEPRLDSMSLATPNAKLGVAVDLRYQFDGVALPNQPVTLHLAAVPRVPGARISLSVKQVEGLQVAAGSLNFQKTGSSDLYRQQLSVTRGADSPTHLRVLVTMELASGSAFGFYSIPLDGGTSAQKQDSVKQR